MFYKIINFMGCVLYNKYEKSAEMVLGYGGVWGKDHRKAKRFKSEKEVRKEIEKMHYRKGTQFLMVSNKEDWKEAYKRWKKTNI